MIIRKVQLASSDRTPLARKLMSPVLFTSMDEPSSPASFGARVRRWSLRRRAYTPHPCAAGPLTQQFVVSDSKKYHRYARLDMCRRRMFIDGMPLSYRVSVDVDAARIIAQSPCGRCARAHESPAMLRLRMSAPSGTPSDQVKHM